MEEPVQPDRCPLCGEAVDELADAVRTGPFLTKRDPLWRYAGRAMHRDCFQAWERGAEFVRKFNIVHAELMRMDEAGHVTDFLAPDTGR